MWILLAISAAFFFALVHVLDSHCVGEIFEKPWIGVITSSIASIVVFQLIPFVGPFVSWDFPSIEIMIMAFLAGVLIQTSQAFYFQALAYSEAGIVAAYWNMIPAILPIVSFILFRNVLSEYQYIGITILIASSVFMCLLDSNFHTRWKSFFLLLAASIMQVIAYLMEDIIFDNSPLFLGFLIITTGLIFAGLIPLLMSNVRKIIKKNSRKLISLLKFFVLIEIANLVALFMAQSAISKGDASLVAAVETTMPAHAFLLSFILLFIAPKYGDKTVKHKLHYKLLTVFIMAIGVWFVS